ncbi:hypothetical protein E1258_17625 [Micromonospora sp. KC207]|uniref:hypothetical protein n=1 Tax=Micromonospora sp. KC207 TaxID=2530377 RepID=UPI00104F0202|nr:hypothetical protein [Micromonospora sp. KC207]TDC59551.1 hypothetical protein E1258_17625 [Micromonospora sp. KC207]
MIDGKRVAHPTRSSPASLLHAELMLPTVIHGWGTRWPSVGNSSWPSTTLRGWVNAAKRAERNTTGRDSGSDLSASERDELRRLRSKVAELELEKEILRKAAAYCAKEMGR